MGPIDPSSGAAGDGFIMGAAGPLLLLGLLVVVLGIPAVREEIAKHFASVREHFWGPQPAGAEGAAAPTPEETAQQNPSARASDRDEYDFDLSLLALGDTCELDVPPDQSS